MKHVEEAFSLVEGYPRLILRQNGTIIWDFIGKNTIVSVYRLLFSELLMGASAPGVTRAPGITHLALGSGDPLWPETPPVATADVTELEDEVTRKALMSFSYVDESHVPVNPQYVPDADGVNTVRTGRVQLGVTFLTSEGNAVLREMGLFGGHAANLAGKGTQVNYYTFPTVTKTSSQTLEIIWELRVL